jgi:molybdopterin synthase catalytic subunit
VVELIVRTALVEGDPLNLLQGFLGEVSKLALDSETGGVEVFVGVVKGRVAGVRVEKLVYTAYGEVASRVLERIAREEGERFGLEAVAIFHRVGEVKPGEATVVIAVAGRGREEVNKATKAMIDKVKKEAPIFKLEVREDGEYWVLGDETRIKRSRS